MSDTAFDSDSEHAKSFIERYLGRIILASLVPIAVGVWHFADVTGYRPAFKYELDRQGLYLTRNQLLVLKEDGKLSEYERGILHGICYSLQIKDAECETKDW